MSKKPYFSVVIPTRNRAKKLPCAIQSVTNQKFSDFEIIISDNFSSDDTPLVSQEFNDKRIKYFRSTSSLSMNDSWKFALTHAKGEYITFLSDDDAYSVDLFSRVKPIIEATSADLLYWKFAYYYPEGYKTFGYPLFHPFRNIKENTLMIPTFCSNLFEMDSFTSMKRALLYDSPQTESLMYPRLHGPQFTNAVYHHRLFDRIKKRGIDLFRADVVCDVYAGNISVSVAEKSVFLDEPLTLFSINAESATSSINTSVTSLANSFGDGSNSNFERWGLINSSININYFYKSILQAAHDVGLESEGLKLNRRNYFLSFYESLMAYKNLGVEIGKELDEFNSALLREPESVQKEVKTVALRKDLNFFDLGRRKIPRFPTITKTLAYSSPQTIHNRRILVNGAEVGFDNITECAVWLDEDKCKQFSDFCVGIYRGERRRLNFPSQIA